MHEYEIAALKLLKKEKSVEFEALRQKLDLDKDKLMWALEQLRAKGLVELNKKEKISLTLTGEAKGYLKAMPEEELAKEAGIKPVKISSASNIALTWAKKNGWIEIKGGQITATAKWKTDSTKPYPQRVALLEIEKNGQIDKQIIDTLTKRGLAKTSTVLESAHIKITEKGMKELIESGGVGALSHEVIATGSWKKDGLRPYDVKAPHDRAYVARLHPVHEMIEEIRKAWFGMGFIEATGPIVESSFWNFDALFSPQDHPTREMQDTFFLSNPKLIDIDDLELLSRVKKMHKTGWKQVFNEDLSKQAVLRTHTTSVSARGMQKYAEALAESYPVKLFSVGRVFRNEAVDYKHLAEFYQTDGIIIGDGLSLSNLLDVLSKFYSSLGMKKVRFKPSYFPFTEPSVEIQYYDEERGEEMEIGGAGIIRKEITKAMGTNKTVLAWGLSIDRLLMNRMKISTISDLYKNDISWLRNRPGVRV